MHERCIFICGSRDNEKLRLRLSQLVNNARQPDWTKRVIPWLDPDQPFPPLERALREPNGLLAAGGALTTGRLLDAYQ